MSIDIQKLREAVNAMFTLPDKTCVVTSKNEIVAKYLQISCAENILQILNEIEELRKAQSHQLCELSINQLMTQIEELRNTRAEPVRKVKLPQRYSRSYDMRPDDDGRWLDIDDVITSLKAAGIEVTE